MYVGEEAERMRVSIANNVSFCYLKKEELWRSMSS